MSKQISSSELAEVNSEWDEESSDEHLMESVESAAQRMKDLLSSLQEQNHSLLLLSPLLQSFTSTSGSRTGKNAILHFFAYVNQGNFCSNWQYVFYITLTLAVIEITSPSP